jgi:hypothetical protein
MVSVFSASWRGSEISGRVMGSAEAGMSEKYFSTMASASALSKSPTIASAALLGA